MSDVAAADQLSGVVRRLISRLNRKLADLLLLILNNKSAGSLGALAGLAIAVVFTWKLLRSQPRGSRGNQPKRRDAPSTSAGTSVTQAQLPEPNPQQLDTSEAHFELTQARIVRMKLRNRSKMTCRLLGVILEETSPEQLLQNATIRPSVVEIILEIVKICDLYLMETVLDDDSEGRALSALEGAGLFKTGGLHKEKVLFCSMDVGRTSFVRQLEPDLHVDTDLDIVSQLARFIKSLLHISSNDLDQIAPNVFTSTSLEQYFER